MNKVRPGVFIGDVIDAQDQDRLESVGIERVVSLTPYDVDSTTHHHPLEDGDNPQGDFNDAVERVIDSILSEETTFVHCVVGSSRTGAVVAAALADVDGKSFDEALTDLQQQRATINPHPDLRDLAQKYLKSSSR